MDVPTVLWSLLALLGLVLLPVVVKVLRREKWTEPPPRSVHTSPYAAERADTELAERTQAAVNRELVARDFREEIDAIENWSRYRGPS